MKKFYAIVLVLGLSVFSGELRAQCSVTISATSTTDPGVNTTQLTCRNNSITLKANGTGDGMLTFSWVPAATSESIIVTQEGTYTVRITDAKGCTSSSSVIITKDTTLPGVSILPIPDTICAGSTANLIAFGANTYTWNHTTQSGAVVQVSPETTTTYTVTGTAANGCKGTGNIQVVVRTRPSGSISGTTAICQNASPPPVLFTGSGGTRPYTFTYSVNGGATQTITTTQSSDQVTIGAPTGNLDTLQYNLISVADRNGCSQTISGTATVTVLPGPVLASPKAASVCDGASFSYTARSSAAGTSYAWVRLPANNITGSGPASGTTDTISETLENPTPQPIEVYYVFSLSIGSGCITKDTLKVTVNPTPVINFVEDINVCNGTFIKNGVQFSSSSPGATFTWTNDNPGIGLPVSGSGNIPGFNATANTAIRESANIVVFVKSGSGGCEGPSIPFRIVVFPGPVLVSPKTASVCDSSVFQYTARSSAQGTRFTWSRAAVDGISNRPATAEDSIIRETLYNTTSQPIDVFYVFTISTGTECDTKDSVRVTVNPTPVIDSIPNVIFCNGASIAGILFNTKSPNPTFTWTNNNRNIGLPVRGSGSIPDFVATNTSDSIITATIVVSVKASADGCAGQNRTFTITVRPGPALTSPKTASVCDNAPFNYTATSSAQGTAFSWTRLANSNIRSTGTGNGTTATINETLQNVTLKPVVVTYVLSLSTGGACDTKDTLRVTVNPTPQIEPLQDTTFCNGATITGIPFFSQSPDSTFTWTNSNRNIGLPVSGSGSIPAFTPTNAGDTTISARITVGIKAGSTGCAGPDKTFLIKVRPGPSLTSAKEVSVCDNAPFSYTATTLAQGIKFNWKRLDSNHIKGLGPDSGTTATITEILQNDTLTPQKVAYAITLTPSENTSGCAVTQVVTVTVNPTPTINLIKDTAVCNGAFVIDGIRFSSPTPNAAFTWFNSDTTIGLPVSGNGHIPPFNAKNSGRDPIVAVITVYVKASADSCAGTALRKFSITVRPGPSLKSEKRINVCNKLSVKYEAQSSASNTKFSWKRDTIPGIVTLYSTKRDNSNTGVYSDTTNSIDENLYNTTDEPIDVPYVFTLQTGGLCDTKDTVMVRVYPTPMFKTQPVNLEFCNNIVAQSIQFESRTRNAAFTWSTNQKVGFGDSGTGRIPAFLTNNPGNDVLTANVQVNAFVGDKCPGESAMFTISINPTPLLVSTKDTSVCNNGAFRYQAQSSARVTNFRWRRASVTGISNGTGGGDSALIEETLNNTTDKPITVRYIFTLTTGGGCDSLYTYGVNVTVNPTPKIDTVENKIYCNREFVKEGISFSSPSPNAAFTWTNNNPKIGLPVSGTGAIPGFVAINKTTIADTAVITVSVKASADSCAGTTVQTFRIVVRPSPLQPTFTSLSEKTDKQVLNLCTGSENINFNINTPATGVSYQWSATPGIPIRNPKSENAVISFNNSGTYQIQVIAKADSSGCEDTVAQQVVVGPQVSKIGREKIFLSQPGDLLIYPDNSLQRYQWGMDTIIKGPPDSSFGKPRAVPGQVYQFFVPDTNVNTSKYLYWVLLQDAQGCQSRVYYNGPYVSRRVQQTLPVNSTVQMQVLPNPNNGQFEMTLSGNIYGRVEATVLNSVGRAVFRKSFVKTIPAIKETFGISHLPAGLYFLELQSSDLKKVITRFVIQR